MLPGIASITAPLMYGHLMNFYLFGVLTVQIYVYYLSFPADTKYLKSLVYGTFFLDTIAILLSFGDMFHWFAAGFGNISALDDTYLSGIDTPLIGSFIAVIVQVVYAYRIWKLQGRAWSTWFTCLVIGLAAMVQLAGGMWGAVISFHAGKFSEAAIRAQPSVYMIYGGGCIADLVIAVIMTLLLIQSGGTVHKETRAMIKRLLNLVVETNAMTSSLALLTIVLILAFPNKVYAACM